MAKNKKQNKTTKQRSKPTPGFFGHKPDESATYPERLKEPAGPRWKSPKTILITGSTPWELKQELEWELETLAENHPELFDGVLRKYLEDLETKPWNDFRLRLFETLLSEFQKTDKYKNLQKDIAEPLAAWINMVNDIVRESQGYGCGIDYLLEMASNFKIEDLKKVKEYVKNGKPLRDFVILKEHELVYKLVKSVCKNKYRNRNSKFLDLKDKLNAFNYPEEIMRKVVLKKPSLITYELMASKYKKGPTTIRDLVLKVRKAEKQSK